MLFILQENEERIAKFEEKLKEQDELTVKIVKIIREKNLVSTSKVRLGLAGSNFLSCSKQDCW